MFKSKQILGAELCIPILVLECTDLSRRKLLSVAAFLLGLALQALPDPLYFLPGARILISSKCLSERRIASLLVSGAVEALSAGEA